MRSIRVGTAAVLACAALVGPRTPASAATTLYPIATRFITQKPQAVAVDATGGRIYVARYDATSVGVVDGPTSNVLSSISVGETGGQAVAVDESAGKIYVGLYNSKLKVIDRTTQSVSATVNLPGTPYALDVDPVRHKVYVLGYTDLWVVDGATNTVQATVPLGYANAIAVDHANGTIYVALANGSVAELAPVTLAVTPITGVGGYLADIAVTPGKVYLTDQNANRVVIVDRATRTARPPVAVTSPTRIAVNPALGQVFVASSASSNVAILEADVASATMAVDTDISDIAANPSTGRVYFVSPVSYNLKVIGPDPVPPNTTLGLRPDALTRSADASFTFSGTDNQPGPLTFRCTLDAVAAPCVSPVAYQAVPDGRHTFSVAAIDAAGNIDPTPAIWSWAVDSTPPVSSFADSGLPLVIIETGATQARDVVGIVLDEVSGVASATVTFTPVLPVGEVGAEPATLDCMSDRTGCVWSARPPALGVYTVSVRATDALGNAEDPGPAPITMVVVTLPA